jgi:hypothetical protein
VGDREWNLATLCPVGREKELDGMLKNGRSKIGRASGPRPMLSVMHSWDASPRGAESLSQLAFGSTLIPDQFLREFFGLVAELLEARCRCFQRRL